MPLERLKKLNTRDCLWIYILKLLSEKGMHGYIIRNEIQKRFGFRPGTVTAYKVLYLLTKKGLVKKEEQGGKQVYSITPEGKVTLNRGIDFYQDLIKKLG